MHIFRSIGVARTRFASAILLLLVLLASSSFAVLAQSDASGVVKSERVSADLLALQAQSFTRSASTASSTSGFVVAPDLNAVIGDTVVVDAIANGDPAGLLAELEALGLRNGAAYGNMVSGLLPISSISQLTDVVSLNYIRPAAALSNVGLVDSEAIEGLAVDTVFETYGLDGSGQQVGLLSDSFDCGAISGDLPGTTQPNRYSDDIASGDLPAGVIILEDVACGSDEGRGMAQLVYDLVPGADLAFHTAFSGQAGFAQGIIDLANVGSTVISDDVIYFAEPMFADGIIAQAADTVNAAGIPYFSSAGNRDTSSYEAPFRDSGETLFGLWLLHDFDPGPGVDTMQSITLQEGEQFIFSFQWSEPYASTSVASPGSSSDLDVLIFDQASGTLLGSLSGLDVNVGGDPIEVNGLQNPGPGPATIDLAIGLFSGAPPAQMKYVNFGSVSANASIEHFTFSPSAFGHNNAAGAVSVGAAFWGTTPAWQDGWDGFPNGFADYVAQFGPVGGTTLTPPLVNSFSSYGGVPILFDIDGNALPAPELRAKPEITAIDGTNTTFFFSDTIRDADTFPNFFGTSAAAPHAAAVAALMLEADPTLTPDEILTSMQFSAIDILGTNDVGSNSLNDWIPLPVGFDNASGAGLIQADVAVQLSISSPSLVCNGLAANVYVENGVIFGGPLDGQAYNGILRGDANVNDVIAGTNGDDQIRGGSGDDTICGFSGDDTISGEPDDDTIYAGSGDDVVDGDSGEDTIFGEDGDDSLEGDNGNDSISGGEGDDYIEGGNGEDAISGDAGEDTIVGNGDADFISGGPDADDISGNDGADTLYGDGGEDVLDGGNGDDELHGGADADELSGDSGEDELFGDAGDDVLLGNDDDDFMDGGDDVDMCNGGNGIDLAVNCEVLESANEAGGDAPELTGFILVNADTDVEIGPLADGDTIDTDAIGTRNLNIIAVTSGAESVIFSGDFSRIENSAPYAVGGDNGGDYLSLNLANGNYTLDATAYSGNSGSGTASAPASINFDVIGS